MKKAARSILLNSILIISLILPVSGTASTPTTSTVPESQQAAQVALKEEVIYATLGNSAEVTHIYAVNIFDVTEAGILKDYGDYSALKNLTTTAELVNDTGFVRGYADKGRFYYQGNMISSELPWDISIDYYLDGISISPDELAGKSGYLKIIIKTAKNNNVDTSFFENYVLQVTVKLDTAKCSNIDAPNAVVANAGTDKLITYSLMPAKQGDILISANVSDFEMEGIEFSAVPFAMNIDMPDTSGLTADMTTLSSAISDLNEGVMDLKSGVKQLKNGVSGLKTGSADFNSGLYTVSTKSKELTDASAVIMDALLQIDNALSGAGSGTELSALLTLPSGLNSLADGLDTLTDNIDSLSAGYSAAYAALDAAISAIPSGTISEIELQELMAANPGNSALAELIANYEAAQTVSGTYLAVSDAFEAVNTNLPVINESFKTITLNLRFTSSEIQNALTDSDIFEQLNLLSQALSELSSNYGSFHAGLLQYTGGIKQLSDVYAQINTGISELASGTSALYSGVGDLSDGTNELASETKNMPEQVESFTKELTAEYDKSDYVPRSFVSSKNTNISSVQFVFKTNGIQVPEVEVPDDESAEGSTFWTRLFNLFR